MPKNHTGLDHRYRDEDGQIRAKNGNTLVKTLRRTYGQDFVAGAPDNATLQQVLDVTGAPSLSQLRKRGF